MPRLSSKNQKQMVIENNLYEYQQPKLATLLEESHKMHT